MLVLRTLCARTSRVTPPIAALLLLLACATAAHAATFTVTDTCDDHDATPGDGQCDNGFGACCLRAAIEEANALTGADTIHFDIPASGVQTITASTGCMAVPCAESALPGITEQLTIDGATQPEASAGAMASWAIGGSASAFVPTWRIKIVAPDVSQTILSIGAADSVIRGLWLHGIMQDEPGNEAALVNTAQPRVTIEANLIETGDLGVLLLAGADDAQVTGNVIYQQRNEGVLTLADSATMAHNWCGLAADGQTAGGTRLEFGCLTTRADDATFTHNLIAGAQTSGIIVENPDEHVPTGTTIEDNVIGLALDGTPLGNREDGITLKAADGVAISGNTVSGNYLHGIDIDPPEFTGGTNVTLTGNLIGVTADGLEAVEFCNIIGQVDGSYSDGGSNTINAHCDTPMPHCCAFDDGTGVGHPGATCVDNVLLASLNQSIENAGGCAGLAAGAFSGASLTADALGSCDGEAPFDGDCVAADTPTPTATPTDTPNPLGCCNVSGAPVGCLDASALPSAPTSLEDCQDALDGELGEGVATAESFNADAMCDPDVVSGVCPPASTPTATDTPTVTDTPTPTSTRTATRTRTPTPTGSWAPSDSGPMKLTPLVFQPLNGTPVVPDRIQ
jgi:hypothetical protein